MKQRFLDLANTCYQHGHYTFSHFLSPAEIDEFFQIKNEVSFVGHTLYGGSEMAERQMLRFGDEDMFGYVEDFPICCIHCRPMTPKFAEKLGHRDVLGALMNLGIERDVIGDIWLKEKECYFFCMENMKEYICDNLIKIRHTNVSCTEIGELPEEFKPERKREEYIIASERCDALVSKVYNLSRSKCIPLFQEKKVFVNSRVYENNSGSLKEGDVVSVRGYGKFQYEGVIRETKKGRLTVAIEKYV
nr:hypothetical protein [Eubacterium sp.]